LTPEEYARFERARDIFRRICDQLLVYVWLRGEMDDLNPPYLLDDKILRKLTPASNPPFEQAKFASHRPLVLSCNSVHFLQLSSV
jgi:hypothetical protein